MSGLGLIKTSQSSACCRWDLLSSSIAFRTAFEEGDASSYEISEEEYAGSDDEYLWVDRLLNTLAVVMQWLQPLLTVNNCDNFVSNLLSKVTPVSVTTLHTP